MVTPRADLVRGIPGYLSDEAQMRRLSGAEMGSFCSVGTRCEVAAGDTLFRRGEIGQCMFIIDSGQIRLDFAGHMQSKNLGEREFFGELALFMGHHARMADAVAVTDCELWSVDQPGFDILLQSQPDRMVQFMRRSFAYLVSSEQQLVLGLQRRNEDLLRAMESLRKTRGELTRAEDQVRTDDMTGLSNRRGLYAYLENTAQRGPTAGPAAGRPGPLQADQRPVRAHGRRRSAVRGRARGPQGRAQGRPGLPAGWR